jgi:hypothetical protein
MAYPCECGVPSRRWRNRSSLPAHRSSGRKRKKPGVDVGLERAGQMASEGTSGIREREDVADALRGGYASLSEHYHAGPQHERDCDPIG